MWGIQYQIFHLFQFQSIQIINPLSQAGFRTLKSETGDWIGLKTSVSPVQSRVKIVEENNKFHNMIRNFINESMIAYKKTKDVELVDKRID